jgi:hypothetical protein
MARYLSGFRKHIFMNLKSRFCFFLFVIAITPSALFAESVPVTVSKVNGDAYVTSLSGKSQKITQGEIVPAGSSIHTGEGSSVGLKLLPGATAVVTPGTDIRLETISYSTSETGVPHRKIRIDLEKGTLLCSLAKHDGFSDFRVSTPDGIAAAHGTDWAVSYSPKAGISVSTIDGIVTIYLPGGRTVTVPGGQVATSPDGITIVTGKLTEDQIKTIISAIEVAGFTPANGSGAGGNEGGGTFNNTSQTSNPANISVQPSVSPN